MAPGGSGQRGTRREGFPDPGVDGPGDLPVGRRSGPTGHPAGRSRPAAPHDPGRGDPAGHRHLPGHRRGTLLQGVLFVLAAATLWGTLGIWARLAYGGGARPNDVVFFRALIAFAAAAWVARRKGAALRAAARQRLGLLAAYGVLSVGLFYLSYFWAVRLLPVAVAAVLLYTAPAFVAVLARLFLGEPLTGRRSAALVVAMAGVVLVSGLGPGGSGAARAALPAALPPAGVLAGLLAGFTYATYSIFGKVAVRDLDPDVVVVYTLGIGSLVLLGALPPGRLLALDFAPAVWPVLVLLGLVPTYLAYRLYTAGLQWVPASTAAIAATVEPVVAALLGWLVLGETLTGAQLLGAGLVLAGAALAGDRGRRGLPESLRPLIRREAAGAGAGDVRGRGQVS